MLTAHDDAQHRRHTYTEIVLGTYSIGGASNSCGTKILGRDIIHCRANPAIWGATSLGLALTTVDQRTQVARTPVTSNQFINARYANLTHSLYLLLSSPFACEDKAV